MVLISGKSLNHREGLSILVCPDCQRSTADFHFISQAFEVLMDVVFSHRILVFYEISGPERLGLKAIGVCPLKGFELHGENRQKHSFYLRLISF